MIPTPDRRSLMDGLGHDELIARLEEEKGVTISNLPTGTKINVETNHSIYQIVITDGIKITILGGMLRSGEFRFPTPVPATIFGSTWVFTNMLKLDWIGRGMQLEFGIEEGAIRTSPINGIEIESADGAWSYAMRE